jgi:hypothetical protein
VEKAVEIDAEIDAFSLTFQGKSGLPHFSAAIGIE